MYYPPYYISGTGGQGMTPDETALLRAIQAAQDDDLPRLVYADWLDEHPEQVNCADCWGSTIIRRRGKREPLIQCPTCLGGRTVPGTGNAARAEFIRVQCELAGLGGCLTPSVGARESGSGKPLSCWQVRPRNKRGCLPWCEICSRSADLREREAELLTHNAARWLPDLPGYNRVISGWTKHVTRDDGENIMIGPELFIRAEFRRGFVEEVRAPLAALFGATCPRCSGEGCSPHAIAANGPCENREGAAAGLWASQPVTRVVLTDAYLIPLEEEVRLGHAPRGWVLGDREGYATANAGNLLESIQDVIDRTYPTRQAALDALSAAACALGRKRAGI